MNLQKKKAKKKDLIPLHENGQLPNATLPGLLKCFLASSQQASARHRPPDKTNTQQLGA